MEQAGETWQLKASCRGPQAEIFFPPAHAERKEFVYEHAWRVGDLLLWDNRCSSHARTDFPSTERRLMLRTTVKGTVRPY